MDARGKFGEHEKYVLEYVFLSALQTPQVHP